MLTKILKVDRLLVYRNHHLLDDGETTTLSSSTSHVYCILLDLQGWSSALSQDICTLDMYV